MLVASSHSSPGSLSQPLPVTVSQLPSASRFYSPPSSLRMQEGWNPPHSVTCSDKAMESEELAEDALLKLSVQQSWSQPLRLEQFQCPPPTPGPSAARATFLLICLKRPPLQRCEKSREESLVIFRARASGFFLPGNRTHAGKQRVTAGLHPAPPACSPAVRGSK